MRHQGFSLLELMITLAIVGILLSFAYPSYQTYTIRSHRLEGQTALLDLAHRMEQHFESYESYTDATIGAGTAHDVLASAQTTKGWYDLSIVMATEQHFLLQATPRNIQAKQDRECQALRFDDRGVQSIASGPSGVPTGTWERCWR